MTTNADHSPDAAEESGADRTVKAPSPFDEGRTIAMPDAKPPQAAPQGIAPEDGATVPIPHAPVDHNAATVRAGAPPGPGEPRVSQPPAADADETMVSAKPPSDATRVSPEASQTQTDQVVNATVATGRLLQHRYRLDKILGRGGFGAAYLAEDVKLKRSCVVKQMLAPQGTSAKDLQLYQANFAREASLLVQLNHPGHPNIPEIYDYFSDDSGNYLVMKYIEGQSLRDALEQSGGKLPWREAVRYMIDIASALNYMHKHGQEPVMHRDIKPANILLGNDNRVWLVDFGLAKAKPVESSGDLMATQAAGSLGYTPLEQWLGEAVPASDVYATGATLHYLVTGQSPSQPFGNQFNVHKLKELHGHFTPIRKTDKSLPQTLEALIERATAANPDNRLTAKQLQQQLEGLISGAQAAALYTFKSGESAKTVQELVDLCDKNRAEAQAYLYGGDFERWFRVINRNDLAQAAEQAVSQGKNQKDGLEKFLKLILPNLAMRRLSRAGGSVFRAILLLALVLLAVGVALVVGGSYATGKFIERTVATSDWRFDGLSVDEPTRFAAADLNSGVQGMAGAYFDELAVKLQPPNQVGLSAVWSGIPLELPVSVSTQNGIPQIEISQVNGIPLFFVAANISDGINRGIEQAFRKSPVDVTALEITENAVLVSAAESRQTGRPAMPTATPTITPTPTPLPTSTPSPTPEGLALVTIFNETGREIVLDIEGDIYEMGIDDSRAIEVPPGSYSYVFTFKDTGSIGSEGEKVWEVKTYIWRVGNSDSK